MASYNLIQECQRTIDLSNEDNYIIIEWMSLDVSPVKWILSVNKVKIVSHVSTIYFTFLFLKEEKTLYPQP